MTNMSNINNSRFSIEKDASNYLVTNSKLNPTKNIAKKEDFSYSYNWDEDFKKFFKIDSQRINEIAKYYSEVDLFLQNIKFDDIFTSLEKTIVEIWEKIAKNIIVNETWNALLFINISPIEWAILGEAFRDFWCKNVVYNFNRIPLINSSSKTFEAIIYLLAYQKSPYLQEKTKELISKLDSEKLLILKEKLYLFFDENNNKETYNHLQIDTYLQNQIWLKESKNIYRIDKYPNKEFIISKDINKIIILDNDKDIWSMIEYLKKDLKNSDYKIKIIEDNYTFSQVKSIWIYEDYLIEQNKEYLKYKQEIDKKISETVNASKINESINKKLNESNSNEIYNPNRKISNYEKLKNQNWKLKDRTIIPYLIMFPILVIAFLMSDLNWWSYYWNNSYGWWTTIITWWSSSSNSSVSSSKSSSSIIKSFGWGWFSKWSSS